jgi:hypothetical protein
VNAEGVHGSTLARAGLDREEETILWAIRAARDPSADERLRSLVSDPELNWDHLWALAEAHEVTPPVARALTAEDLAPLAPDAARDRARAVRLHTLVQNLALHAELQHVGGALRAHGIPVVPLKGTYVAEAFHEGLDARRCGDIDILVQESRLEEARAILKDLGYQPMMGASHGIETHLFHGVPYVRHAATTTFVIELHWGLNDPRFVSIDYAQLWDRILVDKECDAPLTPMPVEETLLFLALHHPKHDTGLLRLLADIDRLVRHEGSRLDWSHLVRLARQWNGTWLLYFALWRAHRLLGTPLPHSLLNDIAPPRWRRAAVTLLAGPKFILRPPKAEHLRSNQSGLAYCAMIDPFARAFAAYLATFYPPLPPEKRGVLATPSGLTYRLGHGLAWTGLAIAHAALIGRGLQLPFTGTRLPSRHAFAPSSA